MPKKCSNDCTIALISHASKIILKILQASLQQYVNCELPDVQAGFRERRGTGDQIVNIRWTIEKARELQKNIYICFILSFVNGHLGCFHVLAVVNSVNDRVDHNKLWKILQEMGIPDYLTCLLRSVYAG